MPGGRPTAYTEEKADLFCSLVAHGKTIKEICDLDEMPHPSTIADWLSKHAEFADKYARAKTVQAELDTSEIQLLAQQAADGLIDPNAARVAIDARKWLAGKRAPKVYGENYIKMGETKNTLNVTMISNDNILKTIENLQSEPTEFIEGREEDTA